MHAKEKTIIRIRQYLCGSAICLRPRSYRDFIIIREKIQSAVTVFPLAQKTQRQHNKTLITKLHFLYKTSQKKKFLAQAFAPWTKSQKISY